MDATRSSERLPPAEPTGGESLSRRTALVTAAMGAALVAAAPDALAQNAPAAGYGAPIVEVFVPAGVLSAEQRAEMIRRITEVVLGAMSLPPDPLRRMFVEVFETAAGGFGVNGKVFAPAPR